MPAYESAPYSHGSSARVGVLLTNLGTPTAPTPTALRRYLAEFLSDPRVVEVPRWLWLPILHGVILRFRPRRSSHAYAQIWSEGGSPLLVHSRQQLAALNERLAARYGDRMLAALGMRYGAPSIRSGVRDLLAAGAQRLIVLPLYPQYAAATTGSTFDALAAALCAERRLPDVRFIACYHDHPDYIEALRQSLEQHWATHGRTPMLLFSFHGIPERYLRAGDPYHCHCHKTARLVASALGLAEGQWRVTFQSRFGREPWLRPYTDVALEELGRARTPRVDVCCPGFAADCLETLEEIALRGREIFVAAGGGAFHYIPALNAAPAHIDLLERLCIENSAGWPEVRPDVDGADDARQRAASRERALALGASD